MTTASTSLLGLFSADDNPPLNELPSAVGALVRFISAVDLPVPVERARVGQPLAADLAGHAGLPVRAESRRDDCRGPTCWTEKQPSG